MAAFNSRTSFDRSDLKISNKINKSTIKSKHVDQIDNIIGIVDYNIMKPNVRVTKHLRDLSNHLSSAMDVDVKSESKYTFCRTFNVLFDFTVK